MTDATFDDRDGVIWFDGALKPWRDANVHILTHAMHYASAVFEGERAYGGKVFELSQHSQRLIEFGEDPGVRPALDARADRRGGQRDAGGQRPDQRLCAPDRLARIGTDGRVGAADQAAPRHRLLGMGRLFRGMRRWKRACA